MSTTQLHTEEQQWKVRYLLSELTKGVDELFAEPEPEPEPEQEPEPESITKRISALAELIKRAEPEPD
ncbi:MAG TPA: hypothetical protein EYG17_08970 [Acidimicrobiia bacterium]|jgi:hypothetical protein|nr:hypothetical protein [Acidimicrobiia bacterium]HIL06165.1 hypothetical protein [Acidimicrobiia bacterium]